VVAASEEASTNVQSVATATEELTSSGLIQYHTVIFELLRKIEALVPSLVPSSDRARRDRDRLGQLHGRPASRERYCSGTPLSSSLRQLLGNSRHPAASCPAAL
jgi:hypothetical protein